MPSAKLQQEITLEPLKVRLPPQLASSDKGEYRLFSATVPVDHDIFRKIVVRSSRIPRIDPADFSVTGWTERSYYEVCTDPAIYAALEKRKGAGQRARQPQTTKQTRNLIPRCPGWVEGNLKCRFDIDRGAAFRSGLKLPLRDRFAGILVEAVVDTA